LHINQKGRGRVYGGWDRHEQPAARQESLIWSLGLRRKAFTTGYTGVHRGTRWT